MAKKTTKKKVPRSKVTKKKTHKKAVPMGRYSLLASAMHQAFQEMVRSLAPSQSIGMMKRLKVEQVLGGVQVSYQFNWRGVPEEIVPAALVDLASTTMGKLPTKESAAIVVTHAEKMEFEVKLNW